MRRLLFLFFVVFFLLQLFDINAEKTRRQSFPPIHQELNRPSRAPRNLTAAEKINVSNAINTISGKGTLSYVDATGTEKEISCSDIAKGLKKQLDDGRIKVDPNMRAGNYAVTTQDGKATDAGDKVELDDALVDGTDQTFLEEVLVHEYVHKLQAGGTVASDEVEAYGVEKAYKDTVGVSNNNAHYKECVGNLAYYQNKYNEVNPQKKKNRSSHIDVDGVHYQVTLSDETQPTTSKLIYFEWGYPVSTYTEVDLGFHAGDIISPAVNLLVISGGLLTGEVMQGVIQHVEITAEGLEFSDLISFPPEDLPLPSFFHHIDYDETDPLNRFIALDTSGQRVTRLNHSGDWHVDSFFDVFVDIDISDQPVYRMEWATHPTHGRGLILDDLDQHYGSMRRLDEPITIFTELDETTHNDLPEREFREMVPVIQYPLPLAGDVAVNVFGTHGSVINVWLSNEFGEPITVLGTGTILVDNEVIIPLLDGLGDERQLLSGEYITIEDVSSGEIQWNPYRVPLTPDDVTPEIHNPFPYPGNTMVNVYGTPGHVIQVWKTDIAGSPLEQLGALSTPPDNNQVIVPLLRSLTAGEYLKAIDPLSGDAQPEPYQVPDMDDVALLRVGDWLNPQEWHDWIGKTGGGIVDLQLHIDDPDNFVTSVTFSWSIDEFEWIDIITLDNRLETPEETYGDETELDPGWFTQLDLNDSSWYIDSFFDVFFEVDIETTLGPTIPVSTVREFDPQPPNAIQIVNLDDWQYVPDSFFDITYNIPAGYSVSSITAKAVTKVDSFWKGVPTIDQRNVSNVHCAPTAAASCLKWFEAQGDNDICGVPSLSDIALVRELAKVCGTTSSGTTPSNLAKGIKQWIAAHGGGYTVRGPLAVNWKQMRDELERGQDVLSGIYWPNGGGHRMTMNSFVNKVNSEGKYKIDFMDPWGGTIGWGELDPNTGQITGFTGQSGNSGKLDKVIIVCPEEQNANTPVTGGVQVENPSSGNTTIQLELPQPGLYFIHTVIINSIGNSTLLTTVINHNIPVSVVNIVYSEELVTLYWPGNETDSFHVYSSSTPDSGTFTKVGDGTWTGTEWTYTEEASAEKKFYYVVRVID
ncbi:MAG: hypothetical protein PHR06_03330 [Candidatus Cloacimonetes bacterium]|nr:hypothetical protein [Candidatus Cloacimonadota bacterium]